MRILVVEDDEDLRTSLCEGLREAGYAVDQAGDGRDGLFAAQEYPIDLAIVDLGLPEMSGIELIRRLRDDGGTCPILILTARDRWQDKVEGLESGADDYLVKPFHIEELLARMNALLRRSAGFSSPVMRCAPVELDTVRQVVTVHDRAIELTTYEYKVLEYLMHHAGEVVSKTRLSEHIYEEDLDRDSNVIEVFVGRLRRKLDPDSSLAPIETLRGRGYRLTLERET
jgi:two-component system, OmpR family, response regulator PhoP